MLDAIASLSVDSFVVAETSTSRSAPSGPMMPTYSIAASP